MHDQIQVPTRITLPNNTSYEIVGAIFHSGPRSETSTMDTRSPRQLSSGASYPPTPRSAGVHDAPEEGCCRAAHAHPRQGIEVPQNALASGIKIPCWGQEDCQET